MKLKKYEKLKPCPFCGGEAEIMEYSDRFQCGCKDEDCIAWVEEMPVYLTRSGAIKDWNNRAERTCFVQHEYSGEPFFHSIHVHELSCGHDVRLYEDAPIYCPYCGAKVV